MHSKDKIHTFDPHSKYNLFNIEGALINFRAFSFLYELLVVYLPHGNRSRFIRVDTVHVSG